MAALGETVAVIDKSGKIVSTSKHLFGVFKEARSAYKERKAELKAEKTSKRAEKETREAQRALAASSIEDDRSVASTRRHGGRSKSVTRRGERSHDHRHRPRTSRYEQDLHSLAPSRKPTQRRSAELPARRRSSWDVEPAHPERRRRPTRSWDVEPAHPERRRRPTRSYTAPPVDMDLAYGEFRPPSPETVDPATEEELQGLVGKVRMALDEADCAHHSVSAMVAHLQKHPDAMAAVALTLAEISTLVAKMAPSALASFKASAPVVFGLLASPQFMIAAGMGLGVTVIMFGGYKIVKQIKASKAKADGNNGDGSVDEMVELDPRVSQIENWRRGVAESQLESADTSVDGEFITPTAFSMSRTHLRSRVDRLRGNRDGTRDDGSEYSRHSGTSRSSRRSTASKESSKKESSKKDKKQKEKEKKDKDKVKEKKNKEKAKKPSPLRQLFKN